MTSNFLKRHGLHAVGDAPAQVGEERLAELEEAAARADRDGAAVLLGKAEDVIPKAWRGFKIEVGIGNYPPDAPTSHRKAMVAKLIPMEDVARKVCRSQNADLLIGLVPLTAEGLELVKADPSGPQAEEAMKLALSWAQGKAMKYLPPERMI